LVVINEQLKKKKNKRETIKKKKMIAKISRF